GQDRHVVELREEISEAREEVHNGSKNAVREGESPHVASDERKPPAARARELEQGRGVVQTHGREASLGERNRMASRSAAEVEQRKRLRRQVAKREIDFPSRMLDVAMGIELEVFLPEPGFPPGHGRDYVGRRTKDIGRGPSHQLCPPSASRRRLRVTVPRVGEPFFLESTEGLPIRGNVDLRAARAPVLICVHGFKGFKNWGFWPETARRLSDAGYCVVRFNFAHSGVGEDLQSFGEPELFE